MINLRIAITALAFSAAGFAGVAIQEGYTERAKVPTKNDRPTVGIGSTFRDDGSPVQLGDSIDPVRAIQRSVAHIAKDEAGLKRCVTGPMHQAEYDVLVDFVYQYGVYATCRSSMVRHTNAGHYADACNAYPLYKYSGGYDCSTLVNGKPNQRCWGVWTRNLERRARCLEAAS